MATPYPRRKKNQTIANQICNKIIYEKNDPSMLNQIANLKEYLDNINYSSDEIAQYIPMVKDRTYSEIVSISKNVYANIKERIYNRDNTLVQILRMYIALMLLHPEKNIPAKNNPLIKFAREFWKTDTHPSLKDSLKLVAIIDQCILVKKYQS